AWAYPSVHGSLVNPIIAASRVGNGSLPEMTPTMRPRTPDRQLARSPFLGSDPGDGMAGYRTPVRSAGSSRHEFKSPFPTAPIRSESGFHRNSIPGVKSCLATIPAAGGKNRDRRNCPQYAPISRSRRWSGAFASVPDFYNRPPSRAGYTARAVLKLEFARLDRVGIRE